MRFTFEKYRSFINDGFNIIDELRCNKTDIVNKNDIILILSNSTGKRAPIRSPYYCYIKYIHVEIGQIVSSNDLMINLNIIESETSSDTFEAEIVNEDKGNSNAVEVLTGIAKIAAVGASIYYGGKFLSKRKDGKRRDKKLKEQQKINKEIKKEEHKNNVKIAKEYKKAKRAEANAEKYAAQERYKQNNKCPRCGGSGKVIYQSGGSDSCKQCFGFGYIS